MRNQSPTELIDEICQIKSQYKDEVSGKRQAWPRSIKERVGLLRRMGVKWNVIADGIGIPKTTLWGWKEGKPRSQGFRQLALVDKRKATTGAKTTTGRSLVTKAEVSIIFRQGHRAECSNLETAVKLLKALEV